MKNLFSTCFLFSLLVCQLVSISPIHAEINYNSSGKTLSVKVEGQALTELLNEIKEKTGIKVEIAEGVDGNVYQEFHNLSLENGLKRLLKTKNYSFIYSGNSIKKISVFPSGIPSSSAISTTSASSIPSRLSSGTVSSPPAATGSRAPVSPSEFSAERQKLLEERKAKLEEKRRQKEGMRRQREGKIR